MKTIGIEALLRWAYCEELPKAPSQSMGLIAPGFGGAWGGIERYGELLTVVDAPVNVYGVVPDFTAARGPHPDALAVHDLLDTLDGAVVRLPEPWEPLVDLVRPGGLTEGEAAAAAARALARVTVIDADGDRLWREGLTALVRRHAVLGSRPDWRAEAPERSVVLGANGKPRWFRRSSVWSGAVDADGNAVADLGRWHEVELDGFDARRREPYPDAYTKTVLDPDPAADAEARAEWEVWRSAVATLAAEIATPAPDGLARLISHRVAPFAESARPWLEGEVGVAGRVLPDLRAAVASIAVRPGKARRGRRAEAGKLAAAT